jgi:hypothetical protein
MEGGVSGVVQVSGRAGGAVKCCRFCRRSAVGDVIDVGADVGRVHRACFVEWDRRQEALEASVVLALFLPDAGESRTELEMEESVARAA